MKRLFILVLAVALTSACTASEPQQDALPEPWIVTGLERIDDTFTVTFTNHAGHESRVRVDAEGLTDEYASSLTNCFLELRVGERLAPCISWGGGLFGIADEP